MSSPARAPRSWLGEGLFSAAMMGWIAWYAFDSYSASSNIQNLLLIMPMAIVSGAIFAILMLRLALHGPDEIEDTDDQKTPAEEASALHSSLGIALALVIYVAVMSYVGFDIATWAFLLAGVFVAGERRPLVLIVFPIVLALFVTWLFDLALSVPIPTILI